MIYKVEDEALSEDEIAELDPAQFVALRYYDGVDPVYEIISVVGTLSELPIWDLPENYMLSMRKVSVSK